MQEFISLKTFSYIVASLANSSIIVFLWIKLFNYKNYLQGRYKNIYRTDLELLDKKVTAVVYEYKENNKIDIYFYYHNAMVWITSKSDVLNEEFFKSFSLG